MNRAQGFTIIKVLDGYYKVFLCWRADSRWRLSSGAKLNQLKGTEWAQVSGSVYSVTGDEGGMDLYQRGILYQMLDAGAEVVKLSSISSMVEHRSYKAKTADRYCD